MCSLIVIRTFAHRIVTTLAEHATVPVINAFTGHSHPCQILSDLYTLRRAGCDLDWLTVAWVGDGNNVLHSWLQAATLFGFRLNVAVPDGFDPDGGLFIEAERRSQGGVRRRVMFAGFQVNEELMALARPDALFVHCLPAHRGEEVTDAVMDGPQSIVMGQAENRLHLQKGLMAELVRGNEARGRGARERQAVATTT